MRRTTTWIRERPEEHWSSVYEFSTTETVGLLTRYIHNYVLFPLQCLFICSQIFSALKWPIFILTYLGLHNLNFQSKSCFGISFLGYNVIC